MNIFHNNMSLKIFLYCNYSKLFTFFFQFRELEEHPLRATINKSQPSFLLKLTELPINHYECSKNRLPSVM